MSGRQLYRISIQTRAEGERLYVRYDTDVNIVKLGMILGEKILSFLHKYITSAYTCRNQYLVIHIF